MLWRCYDLGPVLYIMSLSCAPFLLAKCLFVLLDFIILNNCKQTLIFINRGPLWIEIFLFYRLGQNCQEGKRCRGLYARKYVLVGWVVWLLRPFNHSSMFLGWLSLVASVVGLSNALGQSLARNFKLSILFCFISVVSAHFDTCPMYTSLVECLTFLAIDRLHVS